MSVDWPQVRNTIIARAQIGLQNATEYALGRAKHHAPVRAIFERDPRGKAFAEKNIRSKAQYQRFLASKSRSKRFDIGGNASIVANLRAEQAGGIRRQGRAFGATGTTRGHSNSLFPIFRGKDNRWGKFKITGDFRDAALLGRSEPRYNDPRLGRAKSEALKQRPGRTATLISGRQEKRGRERAIAQAGIHNRLTNQGRKEIARAASVSAQGINTRSGLLKANSALFQGRIGGRLRGEIRMTRPVVKGGFIWMTVESPTPYAVHQEFGTRYHRAQPFLRPALYESRNILRSEVQAKVGTQTFLIGRSAFIDPQDFSGGPEAKPEMRDPDPLGGKLEPAQSKAELERATRLAERQGAP